VTADRDGCFASDSITIGVMDKPAILLSDTVLCKGQEMILDPRVAATDTVIWENISRTHWYKISNPGVYSVQAFNKCGTDLKNIAVTGKLCPIIMPTAFTPNQDGRNDFFKVKYPELLTSFHLAVYNRFGQKIFETANSHKGWDGTAEGMPQPTGTYVWSINYTDVDNNERFLKGYVVLLR
jgi:gliding motility-associated-like protein